MVDYQTISIVFAGLSLSIAAIYYISILRINQRNSKIALTNNIMQSMLSKQAQRDWIELMNMVWRNYDDFERKYGSDVDKDIFATRMSVWQTYNLFGHLLRKNVVDAETCYIAGGNFSVFLWFKFKPILIEHAERYAGRDTYSGLEYLAEKMLELSLKNDPSYKVPEAFTKYIPNQSVSEQ